jgi:hypothetical protein
MYDLPSLTKPAFFAPPVRENPSKQMFYTATGEEKRGFPLPLFADIKRPFSRLFMYKRIVLMGFSSQGI